MGDGHGDWYDRQGNLKAKTVSGELKMFSGREKSDDELANRNDNGRLCLLYTSPSPRD